jgi:hypothetical protein
VRSLCLCHFWPDFYHFPASHLTRAYKMWKFIKELNLTFVVSSLCTDCREFWFLIHQVHEIWTLNLQESSPLLYLLSYQAYRNWWWVLILYKYTRFELSTRLQESSPLLYLLNYQAYGDWWWVLILYKYTRFEFSIFRNLVHCSTCRAIKPTEIGGEFLSFISTRDLNSQPLVI